MKVGLSRLRCFGECQAGARLGFQKYWDSFGGSLLRGVIMGIRYQQWPWFGAMVRTGREKTAALFFENASYACFVPGIKCTRRCADRMKEIEVLLFPGIIFCRMSQAHL